jgi:hypothetical protein
VERSRPRPRVPRATEGAVDVSTHFTRAPKMGTVVNGTYLRARFPSTLMGPWTRALYFVLVILPIQMMLLCGGRYWS